MEISKYFKFTNRFIENETDGLLKHFPELNTESVYQILKTEYISNEDDSFGVTKIKSDKGEVFDISELERLPEGQRAEESYWCFVYSDVPQEFEFVEPQ